MNISEGLHGPSLDELEGCWQQRVLQADIQPKRCPSTPGSHPGQVMAQQRGLERWLSLQGALYEFRTQALTQKARQGGGICLSSHC